MTDTQEFLLLFWLPTLAIYAIAICCAFFSLWRSRTPQGAVAWIVALMALPIIVVPLFLFFGRNKFYGYVKNRKNLDAEAAREMAEAKQIESVLTEPEKKYCALNLLGPLCGQPGYTHGNKLHLLIDGEQAYDEMIRAISEAQDYILFQFFIIRDDQAGERFAAALRERARAGVKVFFLYDSVGTSLKKSFILKLTEAGVKVAVFRGMRYWHSRAQVNFRNHRKIVVTDGKVAFTGGFNIGEDYLGRYKEHGPWRDTHVRVDGPAALNAQLVFAKDWYWATQKVPDLNWKPHKALGGTPALILGTGPADNGEPCLLSHIALINAATKRLWIANPYYVPPEPLTRALELAVLRGVDVRVMVPSYSDNKYITYASPVYQELSLKAGVRIFEYLPGFLHQKVMLVDDDAAVVGSVNLDSRSFFINFEVAAIGHERSFVKAVEMMLVHDFERSKELPKNHFIDRPLWKQIRSRATALLSPML